MARKGNTPRSRAAAEGRPAGLDEGWWGRLSAAQQHLTCLLVLLVVSVAFFAPLHFTGKTLVASDTVQWRSMAETTLATYEATGERPLWAPNAFAGMPAYTISYPPEVPQLDTIINALREVVWPTSHFLLLLVGTYLLVVLLTRNRLAGVLAAVAYGLTTYLPVILVAGHNTKFIALCYAPWLALAFAYVLRRPGLLAALAFAVAAAVNLRANHIQITYYFTFALGLWWLVEAVGAVRHGRAAPFAKATGFLALGAGLALLMVAQPYLTMAEYKALTIRGGGDGAGGGGLAWDYAMNWSQGFGELVTLLIADAYGGGSPTYWGPKIFTSGPHYVGGIVLLLAALALWRYRRNAVYGLGLAALAMVLFALGENAPLVNRFMFAYFPLFSAFRVPETWLSAVAFALAVLAGLGLFYIVRPEASAEAERQKTKAIYTALGAFVGLVVVLLVMKGAFFSFERPGEYEQVVQQLARANNVAPTDPRVEQAARQYLAQVDEERAASFTGDALRTLLFLLLAGGALVAYRRGKMPAWAMQGALVLLVLVDLWGVSRRYFSEEDLVEARAVEQEIPTYGFDRYLIEQQEQAGGLGHFRVISYEQGSPIQNARPSYFYESLGGYSAARLQRFQDFMEHVLQDPQTGLPNETALDLLNTRYLVAPGPLPGTEVVYQDEQTGLAVLRNPDALPRAFFVGETEVVPTAEATWARLRSPAFDPGETALLPAPIDFETTPLDSASTAEVELVAYTPDEITWRVRTEAPRLLVVSEIYYPAGWEATLDGEAVPIYRADYLLRAVPIPEGEHTLVMRFAPRTHTVGVWVSGITTGLVYGAALLLLGLAWRRREEDTDTSDEEDPKR